MRNPANDEIRREPVFDGDVPTLESPYGTTGAPASGSGKGALWAVVAALCLALAGLGAWSQQRIVQLEQQLLATQESFARVSEEASGRLQDISGKVNATESTVIGGTEQLKLQLQRLQGAQERTERQLATLAATQEDQGKHLGSLRQDAQQAEQTLQQGLQSVVQLAEQLQQLKQQQTQLQAGLQAQEDAGKRLQADQQQQLQALQKRLEAQLARPDNREAVARLEQELLVLRSELETRAGSQDDARFDAFRAQVTRDLSTLQTQLRQLAAERSGE